MSSVGLLAVCFTAMMVGSAVASRSSLHLRHRKLSGFATSYAQNGTGSAVLKTDEQQSAAQGELDQVYGKGAPPLPAAKDFSTALTWFHSFAAKHGIEYALAYGSALGQRRHPEACFLPYDHDMDVFVGPEAADILTKLIHENNQDVTFADNGFAYTSPTRLLLYKDNDLPQTNAARKRHDCNGQEVSEQVDHCSFNGPLARVLFGSGTKGSKGFIDLFVFYRKDGPAPSGADGCSSKDGLNLCNYVPASTGVKLGHTEECKCGQVETRCMPSDITDWELQLSYGAQYMQPDKLWRNGSWEAP